MKTNPHKLGLGTLVTQFAEKDNPHYAHITPIYQTSTFSFPDVQTGADIFAGVNDGFSYTRADNPNARQLARKLAALEGIDLLKANPDAEIENIVKGRVFTSGMAAITTALMARLEAGSTIITQKMLYGNAYNFMKKVAPLYGINVVWVEGGDMKAWQSAFEQHPEAVIAYMESPANPTMEIVDIAQVSEMAHAHNTWIYIDNTFATPYCQRPLSLGADVVIHSTTKYLGGHGTIIAGAVISRHPEFFHPTKDRFFLAAKVYGGSPSPFDTWLTNIGLKTFELRMQRHIENAACTAEWLEQHPKISKVYYPGLENFPGYQIAQKQMFNGYGGMLSFELAGGFNAGVKLMESLKLITLAVSLGNVDSLIQHPASMTHAAVSPEDRLEFGITDSLIRFSVGIENIEDVIADLDQALEQV
ncbi:MAG: aminotransferase class I/II-fold pyridoxal phosphate-dependent enzyme [Anaerolineales bacterium]|nr:aminotransferase class I/II-fold pyridoxal phosphate-dependent enzyme [Anaerolineales bacterium]